jgi:hypothetical protein
LLGLRFAVPQLLSVGPFNHLLKSGVGVEKVRDGNVFSAAMVRGGRVLSRGISLQDSDGKQLFSFLIWKTQSYLRSREQHLRIFVVKVGSRVVALTKP